MILLLQINPFLFDTGHFETKIANISDQKKNLLGKKVYFWSLCCAQFKFAPTVLLFKTVFWAIYVIDGHFETKIANISDQKKNLLGKKVLENVSTSIQFQFFSPLLTLILNTFWVTNQFDPKSCHFISLSMSLSLYKLQLFLNMCKVGLSILRHFYFFPYDPIYSCLQNFYFWIVVAKPEMYNAEIRLYFCDNDSLCDF